MQALVVIVASLVPGLVWVWFFYRQDDEREPVRLIVWAFFAGMLAVVPAALVEYPFREVFNGPPGSTARLGAASLLVGIAEEGAKLVAVYLSVFRRPEFDEVRDGIIYGVTAALGFAALENFLYVTAFGLAVAPARAVVTLLAHACFGGVAGLYLGVAKARPTRAPAAVLGGLLLAAGLHALYDFLILSRLVHPFFAIAVVYAAYRFVSGKLRELHAGSALR